ncbi:cbb3-type cytochrome oxidase assembly protein CcoS [Amaricoccus sp. W119]|uniref:cbb3-type cytochrome oxidase assembly protein CcoS n=1 Tax=Amaricoccus sp. W119 TaxID=3391833 RepID=UPI0039A40AB0
MNILILLIPASLALGGVALVAFIWMLRHNQFEDPDGEAMRILDDRYEHKPADPKEAVQPKEGPSRLS